MTKPTVRTGLASVALIFSAAAFSAALPSCSSDGAPELALPTGIASSFAEVLPEGVAAPFLDLSKSEKSPPAEPWAPSKPTFGYVFDVDYGIRTDEGGKGTFLAPRAHGKHNGIDFLAPLGTDVLAVCDGKAKSDNRGGYGRVVQLVCPMPKALGGKEGLHVSFFYAHLDKVSVKKDWTRVSVGQKVGTVGKTGNAKGPKIQPHLHFEAAVRQDEDAALSERHAGIVKDAAKSVDLFFERLEGECLEPAKLRSRTEMRRDRRVDPFVLLTCAARPKPALSTPSIARLREAQIKWDQAYDARGFDVDRGPIPIASAPSPKLSHVAPEDHEEEDLEGEAPSSDEETSPEEPTEDL